MPEMNISSQREIVEFYKEEFLKHKNRLRIQKEFYFDKSFSEIENGFG
jgi:hypothetical protein